MTRRGRFKRAWRHILRRTDVQRAVSEEMAFHIQMSSERIMREEGMSMQEAMEEAHRRFGGMEGWGREGVRIEDRRRRRRAFSESIGDVLRDTRLAFRSLRRRPGFSITSILILAIGIGATTAIFSVVDGVILRALPYPESDRIVQLQIVEEGDDENPSPSWSGADFMDLNARAGSFEALGGFRNLPFSLSGEGFPISRRGVSVSEGFFSVLGTPPLFGSVALPAANATGGQRSVVLSYRLWQSRFGDDRSVLGQSLLINERPYRIAGVMPPGFAFPEGMELWTDAEVRVPDPPLDFGTNPEEVRGARYFRVIGRLQAGRSLEQAQADVDLLASALIEENPTNDAGQGFRVDRLRDVLVGPVRAPLLVLLGAVAFVLLIACANVANLTLVRASGRRRELAVRRALGAGRSGIARQMLLESVVLGLLGGAAGCSLAIAGTRGLLALASTQLPRAAEVGMSVSVMMFNLIIAVGAGILFGLAPVVQAGRQDVSGLLREESGRHSQGASRRRLRDTLVVGEIAVCMVLLVGAGLMIRTMSSLLSRESGFEGRGVLVGRLYLPINRYSEEEDVRAFYERVLERTRVLSGVSSAAVALSPPMAGGVAAGLSFAIEGREYDPARQEDAGYQVVSPGYFQTMGIPILAGRDFTNEDRDTGESVALVSRAFADWQFSGEDPLGRRITWGDPTTERTEWSRIVGIVGSTLHDGLDAQPRREIYRPFAQDAWPYMRLIVRTEGDPVLLQDPLRSVVKELDAAQPLDDLRTMDEVVGITLTRRRFNTAIMILFAGVALVLASVGLYGVMSYSVTQRTREIGIRMALGARSSTVVAGIAREGGLLAVIGVVIGTGAALALSRIAASLVHGISPHDPIALGLGVLVLLISSLAASYIPAWRASRIDPVRSLRQE